MRDNSVDRTIERVSNGGLNLLLWPRGGAR
jgi:hypothetical protein